MKKITLALMLAGITLSAAQAAETAKKSSKNFFKKQEAVKTAAPLLAGFTGSAELGGALYSGNTDKESYYGAGDVKYDLLGWNFQGLGSFDYAKDNDVKTADKIKTALTARRDLTGNIYAFIGADYLADQFSGYDWRWSESAGLGYKVITQDKLKVRAELGVGVRQSKDILDDHKDDVVGKFNSFIDYKLSPTADFSNSNYVTFGSEGTTIENFAALTAKITGAVSGRFGLETKYNSDPLSGYDDVDNITRASLVYKF